MLPEQLLKLRKWLSTCHQEKHLGTQFFLSERSSKLAVQILGIRQLSSHVCLVKVRPRLNRFKLSLNTTRITLEGANSLRRVAETGKKKSQSPLTIFEGFSTDRTLVVQWRNQECFLRRKGGINKLNVEDVSQPTRFDCLLPDKNEGEKGKKQRKTRH